MATPYSVNLNDPRVQSMLGQGSIQGVGGAAVQLAGDAPDPRGLSDVRGMASTHHMTAGKHEVLVVFGDHLLTVDVYAIPGEPVVAHLICPRCHKTLTVRGDQKTIDFDSAAPNPQARRLLATGNPEIVQIARTGRLSIEAFECTWEMGGDQHAQSAIRSVHTGASLCRQRMAIEDNRGQEA